MISRRGDALLEAWGKVLSRRGDAPAILGTTGAVQRTFSQIEDEARDFEAGLLGKFREGEVIAIQVGNHPAWPALLLACLRQRLVALPLERTISDRERDSALATCLASAVVAAAVAGGSPPTSAAETAAATTGICLHTLKQDPIAWGRNPPSFLKLTSGTTAAPRAIRFQSEQLLADCTQICDTMGIGEGDRNFAVVPVSHSYGFSNLLTPLLARGVPMVLSRDRMPRAVLHDLARTKATVFPGMPVFYQAFAEMEEVPSLPHLRLCISAGAPLPLETARKFRETFELSIHSFYGSSECGGICYDREAALEEDGFVGPEMGGLNLELIDPEAAASRVRVRSAAVADGYFPLPDEEKLGHDCFVPDDLMTRSRGGFRIVGRISDVINVAGKKVNPSDVEAELLSFPGVQAAVVFGRDSAARNQEVAACVVASPAVKENVLLDHCRRRLSGWQVPKRIFFVDEIPINERGKISRRGLAEKFPQ